ncbi:hypothetical protein WNY58_13750 [Neptuniibacter pectenicola]|uniref:HNH endonuclease n=1 Tax=Neptuniibacter pectenicola TaxID=1806669 RepID=A0ABU9TUQ7_9GAMM
MHKCKLCGNEKKLHRSHIIPEFMYKSMYDEESRFNVISSIPDKIYPPKQKGEWEWLLCKDCEQHISKYEDYAARLLNGGVEFDVKEHSSVIEISDIDYQLFKLFQLSVLWRASISTRPIFKEVNLGRHEKIVRNMLLKNNPGKSYNYGCVMLATMHEGKHLDSLVLQPELKKLGGQTVYRFIFGGFWWLYFCSSHKPDKNLVRVFLQESGVGYIFKKEISSADHIVQFAIEANL